MFIISDLMFFFFKQLVVGRCGRVRARLVIDCLISGHSFAVFHFTHKSSQTALNKTPLKDHSSFSTPRIRHSNCPKTFFPHPKPPHPTPPPSRRRCCLRYAVKVFKTERARGVSPEVARECEVGSAVRQTPHPCAVAEQVLVGNKVGCLEEESGFL